MAGVPRFQNSPITESSIRVTVSINGAKSDEWEMASGGGKTAQVSKVRVGYSPNKTVTIPSVSDSGDVTLTRHMVLSSDVWDLQTTLLDLVGNTWAKVWQTPMDGVGQGDYGAASGVKSMVYEGLITSVTPTSGSNESTSVASISMTLTGGTWQKSS